MKHTPIWKLLLKLSPPVMLALLIQSVYNIVDSYFVARYSPEALTALSIAFPIQLLITAVATGTGTGINILVSRMDGNPRTGSQGSVLKTGLFLGFLNCGFFVAAGLLLVKTYCRYCSNQPLVQEYSTQYLQIILLFSLGIFLESNGTKILQAKGNMLLPMVAQVIGAGVNVILDPLLIFGRFGLPAMGVRGAGAATVIGQWCAMLLVIYWVLRSYPLKGKPEPGCALSIYQAGMPSILMQSLYTLYIVGLNLILKQFTEDAVTVLGIYYKLQTFFFIPLLGLQQVILPIISFHYGAKEENRIKQTLSCSILFSSILMIPATIVFMVLPKTLLSIFSQKPEILKIGAPALQIISLSFIPAAFVIMLTVYFQGVNRGTSSICVTVLRQIFLLVPLAWLFHFKGLTYVWLTFPVTEVFALGLSIRLYLKNPSSLPDSASLPYKTAKIQ